VNSKVERTKKLRFSLNSKKTDNVLLEDGMLECVLGPNAGNTRILHMFIDRNREVPAEPDEQRVVYVGGYNSSGDHVLDRGTSVHYDTMNGVISYSSGSNKYIIRAIEDSDRVVRSGRLDS